jgi:predicted cupin superfamily sugar epimerase
MRQTMVSLTAGEIIALLDLQPHPEGGHYRETFRDSREAGGRAVSTAIYFLLKEGEVSRWHRIDAAEIWHWYAGAPLQLVVAAEGKDATHHTLGPNLHDGERPQAAVPANHWQQARSTGEWLSTTVRSCATAQRDDSAGFSKYPCGRGPAALAASPDST